jgi:outer membrane receptor for ferrienterochelin and colicin
MRKTPKTSALKELRKKLDFMGIKNFSLVCNMALIRSRIHFGKNRPESDRAMQGQSPYVANAALFYQNEKIGLNINLQYNVVGKRIVVLGEANQDPSQFIPDTYEMPRNVVDMSFSQRIGKRWEIRGGIKDIFNEAVTFKQFPVFVKEGKQQMREQTTRLFYSGQMFTLGFGFKI